MKVRQRYSKWPKGEREPTKYWLSSLSDDISFHRQVDCPKLLFGARKPRKARRATKSHKTDQNGDTVPGARLENCWRIEHDYREVKQEVGLEGRGWRGFHHHATMSIAVYGFLVSERGVSPSASIAKILFPEHAIRNGYRLRRCGLSATSRIRLLLCADD